MLSPRNNRVSPFNPRSAELEPHGSMWPQKVHLKAWMISIALVLLNTLIWSIVWSYERSVAGENGVMENLQAGCLSLGAVALFIAAVRTNRMSVRVLFAGLGLLYVTFFLREIELRKGDTLDVLVLVSNPPVRNYWLAAAWVIAAVVFSFNAKTTWSAFLDWLRRRQALPIAAAGIFYILSIPFDKDLLSLGLETNQFLEETLEGNATLLMLQCAVMTLVSARTN